MSKEIKRLVESVGAMLDQLMKQGGTEEDVVDALFDTSQVDVEKVGRIIKEGVDDADVDSQIKNRLERGE